MKNSNVITKLKNKERIESVSLFIQCILLVSIIILGVCCIFVPILNIALQTLVVALLFIMSYNNYILFKRKGFTILYALAGVAILVVTVVGYLYER